MVENLPVKSMKFDGLTIEGYSRAAVQTYWRIPEMKLGFDLGAHPWEFTGTPNWFISHTHLDHIASLPVYVARRRMMKMEPPTIYLPEPAVDPVRRLLHAVSRLDRGRLPCNLIGVHSGQLIELSRERIVTPCRTTHRIPSLGYVVSERRKKLKPEYQSLTGEQIRDLRASGTEVTSERRIPLVAYLGDSTSAGLDENPEMYEADILIAELTFVAPGHRPQQIKKLGHMHLDDFVARQDRFRNKHIIAAHFSTRYHPRQVERLVDKAFPDRLGGRFHLWI